MAQFDVHRLADGLLVCDLQTDLLPIPETRLVAPLRDADRFVAIPGLTPVVMIDGKQWVIRVPEMASVPAGRLGPTIATLSPHRDAIKRAIDMLIDGV